MKYGKLLKVDASDKKKSEKLPESEINKMEEQRPSG